MADSTASIRLTLKDRGFARTFDATARRVGASSKRMGAELRTSLTSAARAGVASMRSMFASIKSGAMQLGGLVGIMGFGALTKQAMDVDKQFRRLAFSMGAGQGVFQQHNAIMAKAQESAGRWGQSTNELGKAMQTLFDTVGESDFAQDMIEPIATYATAGVGSVEELSKVVAEMRRQFGMSGEEIEAALPRVVSLANRGGLSIADLGTNLGNLGRTAGVAGLQGEEGMAMLLAMVNQLSAASGNAEGSVDKLQTLFTKVAGAGGAAFLSTVKDSAGKSLFDVDMGTLTTLERFQAVMNAQKSNPETLLKVFGEQGVFIEQAFGNIGDVASVMAKQSQASLTQAQIMEKANANADTGAVAIDRALEKLAATFTKPAMMRAIDKLAENLPALAEAFADLVDVVVENPKTTAGVLIASRGFMGLGGGMMSGPSGGGGAGGGGAPGALGSPNQLLPAAAAAVGAWMAAFDQLDKLAAELGTKGQGFFATMSKAWEELTGGVEKRHQAMQGERLSMALKQTGKASITETEDSFLYGTQRYRVDRADDGTISRREIAREDAQGGIAGDMVAALEAAARRQFMASDQFVGPRQEAAQQASGNDKPVKIDAGQMRGQANQIGQALRQGELRVRITNPEDIGFVNSGPPAPGSYPRP